MLTHLIIENYQSIGSAEFELGGLTVITGPTGSGKSAVFRALGLVAHNQRGNQFLRRGATECKVLIGDQNDAWAVAITRHKTSGKDSYRVVRLINDPMAAEGYLDEPEVDTFTKLGGKTPEEVSGLIRLNELSFASQFDRPYLLDDSGGDIAKTLGELTNVIFVFKAAQEGERQRREVIRDLKAAEAEIAECTGQLQQYAELPAQREVIGAAEKALEAAAHTQGRLARLRALKTELRAARSLMAEHRAGAHPPLPNLTAAEGIAARLARLRQLRRDSLALAVKAEAAEASLANAQDIAAEQHNALHAALVASGKCPMCGQAVNEYTQLASIFSQSPGIRK
jgi:energy-coupling factor transporter ATP-binding protein EcfA2